MRAWTSEWSSTSGLGVLEVETDMPLEIEDGIRFDGVVNTFTSEDLPIVFTVETAVPTTYSFEDSRLLEILSIRLPASRTSGNGLNSDTIRHCAWTASMMLRTKARRWLPPSSRTDGYRDGSN